MALQKVSPMCLLEPVHSRTLIITIRPLCVGHNYIGTEHILLGLLREGEGVAARVMETLGADPSKIRTAVRPVDSTALFGVSCCSAEPTPRQS